MRIHLADSSNERGQYALLSECLFPNHLASFAYPRIFEYFEKSWDELVRIHLAGLPSSNPTICTKVLPEIQSHLTTYADPHEVKAKEQAFEMRIHLTDTTARLQGSQTVKRMPMEQGKPEALFSYAYNEQEEQWAEAWGGDAMKLYLAGYPGRTDIQEQVRPEHDAHLVTYAQQNQATETAQICDTVPDLRPRVIVDSGAFTAWSTGKAIRPQDYAEWALKFDSRWRVKMASLEFMNLDVIGDQDATWKNLEILQGLGMRPLPVVTFGVDLAHLDRALEYPYISLGGLVPYTRNKPKLRAWLDACFARVMSHRKRTGKLCKVHLLGVTTDWVLRRYPCFSSDSSSWVACLRYGEGGSSGLKRLPRYKTSDAAMAATLHALRCEIRKFQTMQDTATKLWQSRGVTFDD